MEISLRSLRHLRRWYIGKPIGLVSYRTVKTAAAKVEVNTGLLSRLNQDIKAGGVVPVFRRALLFSNSIAVHDEAGVYTYAGLYQAASLLSRNIAAQLVGETERTVAYMCGNDASHVITQWAIWMTGNIAVPLTPMHPPEMLKYFIEDSEAKLVVCTEDYEQTMRPITLASDTPLLVTGRENQISASLPSDPTSKNEEIQLGDVGKSNMWYGKADAMLIYTSGTTSKPKGVAWTHHMLGTQIASLHAAWEYQASDVVLHTLPLHHIHGQLNSLNASLAAGARIRMSPTSAPHAVWARLLGSNEKEDSRVTVFHAVPAMYAKLATAHATMFKEDKTREYVRATLRRMRLMCAGSAPLPAALAKEWFEISGHRLLERYGMSEAGMALSNPYRPTKDRTVACVGQPLPGIAARIGVPVEEGSFVVQPLVTVETPMCDEQISLEKLGLPSSEEIPDKSEWQPPTVTEHAKPVDGVFQGELLLKGPGVFSRYWNRPPKFESKDFTADGWFRTGDTASYDGKFRILGRTSVDIIKTSGYKVSALQVESAIQDHPNVADVAVIGVPEPTYGEIIGAVVVLKPNTKLTLKELKDELGKQLAPYQLPKTMVVVEEMPRNAMGKLDKKVIRNMYEKNLELKKK